MNFLNNNFKVMCELFTAKKKKMMTKNYYKINLNLSIAEEEKLMCVFDFLNNINYLNIF